MADHSWGKRASSLFALHVGHLLFKKDDSKIWIEATFHFDKVHELNTKLCCTQVTNSYKQVMKEPHTLTLTHHPDKSKCPVLALIKVLLEFRLVSSKTYTRFSLYKIAASF